jgi:hypothetical protein
MPANQDDVLDYLIPCSCVCFISIPFAVGLAFLAAAAPDASLLATSSFAGPFGGASQSRAKNNPAIHVPLEKPKKPGLMLFSMDIPYESYSNNKGGFALQ